MLPPWKFCLLKYMEQTQAHLTRLLSLTSLVQVSQINFSGYYSLESILPEVTTKWNGVIFLTGDTNI